MMMTIAIIYIVQNFFLNLEKYSKLQSFKQDS